MDCRRPSGKDKGVINMIFDREFAGGDTLVKKKVYAHHVYIVGASRHPPH